MARKDRIKELEALYSDFEERLVLVVNNHNEIGQKIAAEYFGLSQATVSRTLLKRGYKRIVRYEKQECAS